MRQRMLSSALAVVCFVIGYLFWHFYRLPFVELEKELQAIKADGEPMRFEDIVLPVPSSQNAAVIYQQAINALPNLSWNGLETLDAFRFGHRVDEASVRNILKRCQKSLALVKKASRYPHSRWVKWQPCPYSIELRHPSGLRQLLRYLEAEALLFLQEGNVDEALNNCLTAIRIAEHLWEEPVAAHAVYALASFRSAARIVQRVQGSKGIPPEWVTRLMRLISRWDGDEALIRWLQMERVMHIQFFDWLRASPKDAREFALMWSEDCCIYPGGNIAGWMQPISRQLAINELILLRFDRRLLEIARRGEPYDWNEFKLLDEKAIRTKAFGFTFERPKFLRGFAFRPFAMAGEMLISSGFKSERNLPELARSFEVIAETKALQRLLQAALALSLYRHEIGSYPVALADLVPRCLPEVPKDPFDGKPVRYRRKGKGFKLWSVGSNLKDDGRIKQMQADIVLEVN